MGSLMFLFVKPGKCLEQKGPDQASGQPSSDTTIETALPQPVLHHCWSRMHLAKAGSRFSVALSSCDDFWLV